MVRQVFACEKCCKMEVVGLYIDQTKDFNYSMVFVTLTYQTLTLHVLISL